MATVVLAGGGTAGHIEPALAVARQWAAVHPHDRLIFLGTSSGLETTLVPAANFPLPLNSEEKIVTVVTNPKERMARASKKLSFMGMARINKAPMIVIKKLLPRAIETRWSLRF